ncbi:hypothetical protein KY290_007712 [Solanum tuberosum]|uniref:Non-LTR retroelement reverse transcriptase n=1 Tax=Solanum tuberosum TaxID=4113 RepID=A0ABQ7W6C3_SOLTU|nr:hypothetical protein KY290_007712 [Solanum tuberosum]
MPALTEETQDFNHCINVCNLEDQGFTGSKFTWWNDRTAEDCIFKRLDRILCNNEVNNIFPKIEVEQLTKSGSDHSPLLLKCSSSNERVVKPFRFLNFWLKEESFKEVVAQNWKAEFEGNPFSLFHYKLKKVKRALAQWSKETFGNIFQEIATLEDTIKVLETHFEDTPSGENRSRLQKAQAELYTQLQREEEFWKQKAGFEWFKDGERNTKFFHTIVKGRKSRLRIKRIQNE